MWLATDCFVTLTLFLCFWLQETNKTATTPEENKEVNKKEYSDHLTLEESILKASNLLPQDI